MKQKALTVRIGRKALNGGCVLYRPPAWFWQRCKPSHNAPTTQTAKGLRA